MSLLMATEKKRFKVCWYKCVKGVFQTVEMEKMQTVRGEERRGEKRGETWADQGRKKQMWVSFQPLKCTALSRRNRECVLKVKIIIIIMLHDATMSNTTEGHVLPPPSS